MADASEVVPTAAMTDDEAITKLQSSYRGSVIRRNSVKMQFKPHVVTKWQTLVSKTLARSR